MFNTHAKGEDYYRNTTLKLVLPELVKHNLKRTLLFLQQIHGNFEK